MYSCKWRLWRDRGPQGRGLATGCLLASHVWGGSSVGKGDGNVGTVCPLRLRGAARVVCGKLLQGGGYCVTPAACGERCSPAGAGWLERGLQTVAPQVCSLKECPCSRPGDSSKQLGSLVAGDGTRCGVQSAGGLRWRQLPLVGV